MAFSSPISRLSNPALPSRWAPVVLIGVLLSALLAIGAYLTWRDYSNVLAQVRLRSENAALAVAEYANTFLMAAEKALLRVDGAVVDPAHLPGQEDLQSFVAGLPEQSFLMITDPTGRIRSSHAALRKTSLAGEEYFQELAEGMEWRISKQVKSPIDDEAIFTFGRRLERAGQFAGIAMIGIPLKSLLPFYGSFHIDSKVGPNRSGVGMLRLDGWMVTRSPPVPSSYTVSGLPSWPQVSSAPQAFIYADARPVDGQFYFVASRRIGNFPLVAIAAFTKDEALESYYERLLDFLVIGLLAFALLLMFSLWVLLLLRKDRISQTQLHVALVEKAQSELSMRLAIEAGDLALWQMDAPDWIGTYSVTMARFLDLPPQVFHLTPAEQRAFIHPEDAERVASLFKKAMGSEGVLDGEYRILRRDGDFRWLAVRGKMLRDARGHPQRLLGVAQDITERKQSDDKQRLLIAELDHRVKNILATVQSVVWRSLGERPETEAFVGRLTSLAKAHSLLAESRWEGVSIKALVMIHLEAYREIDQQRITIEGGDLLLNAKITQALGMVLHELVTNAAKYGALSHAAGRLAIGWTLSEDPAGQQKFLLQWRETGRGVPVNVNPKKGFGSQLIEQSILHELAGELAIAQDDQGLIYRFAFPLKGIVLMRGQSMASLPEQTPSPSPVLAEGFRLLLVEDSALIMLDMKTTLAKYRFEITSCYHLETALQAARNGHFDIALLDVNLNGELVFPVADILTGRGIPVLFLTGYAESAQWPMSYRQAVRLSKPVQEKALIKAIVSAFEKAPQIAALP